MRAQKTYQNWQKLEAATALFQPHGEENWLFSSPCNNTAMYLRFTRIKGHGDSLQKARQEDKI